MVLFFWCIFCDRSFFVFFVGEIIFSIQAVAFRCGIIVVHVSLGFMLLQINHTFVGLTQYSHSIALTIRPNSNLLAFIFHHFDCQCQFFHCFSFSLSLSLALAPPEAKPFFLFFVYSLVFFLCFGRSLSLIVKCCDCVMRVNITLSIHIQKICWM